MKAVADMTPAEFDAYFAQVCKEQSARGLANLPFYTPGGWCQCSDTTDAESYFEREDHSHGFFHDPRQGGCGRLTQAG